MFAQILVNGIAMGCIYALVTLGFVLVVRAAGVVNFAHGEMVMLGAYLGVTTTVMWGLAPAVGLLATIAAMAVIGALFQRVIVQPLHGKHLLTIVMATVGISIAMQNGATLIWGPYPLTMAPFLGSRPVNLAGAVILPHTIIIIALTGLVLAALHLVLTRTGSGLMIQASAQDPETARLMGIRVQRMNTLVFATAAALAGMAGFLVAPLFIVTPGIGFATMLKGLAVAILGGWGSLQGAILGGLLFGIIETLAAAYLSTAYKDVVAFAVLILMLLVRPQGLFPEKIGEKV